MINFSIEDNITPRMKKFLQENPRFIRSLTKSMGWYVQKRVKKLTTEPRLTSRWRRRSPVELRRRLDSEGKAPVAWLGKLKRAIGYQYNQANSSASIGWTSPTAAMEGKTQEFGMKRHVTDRLRAKFEAVEAPLNPHKRIINIPARPIFDPSMDILQPELEKFMAARVEGYMKNGGFTKKAGSGRKYEVFG